jgi:uncharacterized protein (TIGR03086 family)
VHADGAARFSALVDWVPVDRWDAQSPCDGWLGHDIFDHVVSTEIELMGRMPFGCTAPDGGHELSEKWVTDRDHGQDALNDPDTANHHYDGYFGPTTFAQTIDTFYCADLVVHVWDIAMATAMTDFLTIGPIDIDDVLARLSPAQAVMRQPGLFRPEIAVPSGADQHTRFLTFLGRRS